MSKPGALQNVSDAAIDLFVRMEEFDADDPGQLSAVSLRIMDRGDNASLYAEIGGIAQPNGGQSSHCLGYLPTEALRFIAALKFTQAFEISLPLLELYGRPTAGTHSGAHLNICGGENPEITLCFGSHGLGVLRGHNLSTLVECVRMTCV